MHQFFTYTVLSVVALVLIVTLIQFAVEKEKHAVKQTTKVIIAYLVLIFLPLLFKVDLFWLSLLYSVGISVVFILFLLPIQFKPVSIKLDKERVDERTTIFSRMFELAVDSEKKTQFYSEYPEYKLVDDSLRSLPGLLSRESTFYDEFHFGKAETYNAQLENLFPEIKGEFYAKQSTEPIEHIENQIKKVAKQLGAVDVGFVVLNNHHFYSKKGRGVDYGNEIHSNHKFAVAITVEMDKAAVDQAPHAPVIAESCKQYLNAAKVAVGIAGLIREKGHEATAHIDANYEVICPLVARDAGLGDIGRMGLLMTPRLGPRVRIAVITTTLPLQQSRKRHSDSIQYFCKICEKCAHTCPSRAIQEGNQIKGGMVRYKINHEKCYQYWAKSGTDCARCMSVCPYSHQNNWFHNLVRFAINRNPIMANFALVADHFFYGKVPKIKHIKNIN